MVSGKERMLRKLVHTMSWPMCGGIGSGGFNTDAGDVVDAGAGASRAAAGAGDSAATGTDFGIGT